MRKFKSIILSLVVLFVLSHQTQAQDVRTLNTKVADILAQMPAKSNDHLNRVMNHTLLLGDEGISEILQRIKPAEEGDDVAVRYVVTSLARYSSQKGHEQEWTMVQRQFLKAIESTGNKETQAYLIHQLNYGANEAVIDPLKKFLADDRLCEPVTQLFLNIRTGKVEQAFMEAFGSASGNNQITLVKALGELRSKASLTAITRLEGSSNRELQRAVLAALANIGDPQSYMLLWNAANKVSFAYDPTEAAAAFIKYTSRLGENNQPALCKQACLALMKTNSTNNLYYNQEAAIVIFARYFEQEAMALLLKVADNPDSSFRMAVLQTAKKIGDAAYVQKWVKKAKTTGAATRADIVYMLGERKDKYAIPFIQECLTDKAANVRTAAIWALVKLDEQLASKDILSHLVQGSDVTEAERALQTLLDEKGLDGAAQSIDKATDAGKAGIIQLIASKSSVRFFKLIYGYTGNPDAAVKNAAFAALKNVSSGGDIDMLLTLLAQTKEPGAISDVQAAIVKAARDIPSPDAASASILAKLQQNNEIEKLAPVLAAIGGTQSLKVVAQLFNTSAGDAKQICFKSLIGWNNPAATAYLYQIVKENNPSYRADAFNGFVNQVNKSNWPDDQRLLKLQMIMPLAQTAEEKEKVIDALSSVNTFLALVYINQFLDQPDLLPQAAFAAASIALPSSDNKQGLYGDIPKAILRKAAGLLSGAESDYIRENVNRYLENLPSDPGFVPMFNGVDLSGWKGFVTDPIKKASLKPKELAKLQLKANEKMHNNWSVKDGMIVFNGEGNNLLSDKEYGDFEMWVNWKISKKGDSGIYLRGSPQVQIWDTTRVEVGAQVGSGGLYNNQKNPSKPLKVADNPIEEWNTFHITMIGDKVTVYLNGELVVDNVTLENYWDRNQPIFPTGTIELQAHGTDLAFKDIYIREIKNQEVTLSPEEKAQGFVSLFNGKNLDGWVGNKTDYKAEDGNIVIQPSNGEGGGNLYTEKEYSDFLFRFEFLLTPGANNGLGVRAPLEGDAAYVGMELQILDNTAPVYAELKPYQYHGSVYGVIPAKREFLKPLGEWNYEEVELKGNKIKITLNGTVILDGDIKEASRNGTMDGKEHPGLLRTSGHIGFLGHGSVVKFRNIRLKEL